MRKTHSHTHYHPSAYSYPTHPPPPHPQQPYRDYDSPHHNYTYNYNYNHRQLHDRVTPYPQSSRQYRRNSPPHPVLSYPPYEYYHSNNNLPPNNYHNHNPHIDTRIDRYTPQHTYPSSPPRHGPRLRDYRRRPPSPSPSASLSPSPSSSHSHSHSSSSSNMSADKDKDKDQEGLIDIHVGEYIRDRYKVLGLAGQGTFGTVLDVLDTKYNERLALKVVRSVKRYLEAAYVEIDILEKIRKADVEKQSLCVRLYRTFEMKHMGHTHVCLGFEKLGRSLYEFIKKNKYRGFMLDHVRHFGYQVIKAVAFCHNLKLIHTDLKPENVLLVHSDYKTITRGSDTDYRVPIYTDIRLIDFGGATFEHEHHSKVVNTRQYRSPEVLLGLGWSYPSDMWSIGCILAELITGDLLFGTHEDLEHLALMEKILDEPLPKSLTLTALDPYIKQRQEKKQNGTFRTSSSGTSTSTSSSTSNSTSTSTSSRHDDSKRSRHHRSESPMRESRSHSRDRRDYDRDRNNNNNTNNKRKRLRSDSRELHEQNRERDASCPRPDELLHVTDGTLRWPEGAISRESVKTVQRAKLLTSQFSDPDFVDLLRGLLRYDPAQRMTATQALAHPFFSIYNSSPSSSTLHSSNTERTRSRQHRHYHYHYGPLSTSQSITSSQLEARSPSRGKSQEGEDDQQQEDDAQDERGRNGTASSRKTSSSSKKRRK